MNDFKMGYSPPKLLNGTGPPIAYDPGRSWASAGMRELFLLSVWAQIRAIWRPAMQF